MMGGIDEDAEWLALLVLALALPFLIAAILAAIDLWRRIVRVGIGERRRFDVPILATVVLTATVAGAIRGGWAAMFAVLVVVLTARLVDVALGTEELTGWCRGVAAGRRALLLGLVVGITGALA